MHTNRTLTIAFAFASSDRCEETNIARIACTIVELITLIATSYAAH